VLTVNLESYGDFRTLEQLVDAISSDNVPPRWPVRLTHTIDPHSNRSVPLYEQQSALSAPRWMPPPAPVTPDATAHGQPWFHGVTEGKEADAAKLTGADGSDDGTFFIVEVALDSPEKPAWVLVVMFNVSCK
jgi:hypothetical protein